MRDYDRGYPAQYRRTRGGRGRYADDFRDGGRRGYDARYARSGGWGMTRLHRDIMAGGPRPGARYDDDVTNRPLSPREFRGSTRGTRYDAAFPREIGVHYRGDDTRRGRGWRGRGGGRYEL